MAGIIYGVTDSANIHHDICRTERGAKNFATRRGYTTVSARHISSYNAYHVAHKVDGKWKDVEKQA